MDVALSLTAAVVEEVVGILWGLFGRCGCTGSGYLLKVLCAAVVVFLTPHDKSSAMEILEGVTEVEMRI